MGPRQEAQPALFYEFSLEKHGFRDHLLRSIDRFVDLSSIRAHLADFYSHTGRPSVDPELLIRMLLVGYCFGIRSERRLCEEVHLNLADRWFCRLDLSDRFPDHSTFFKNRHLRMNPSKNHVGTFSLRRARLRSATHSFKARDSERSSFTSGDVACRAVSPDTGLAALV